MFLLKGLSSNSMVVKTLMDKPNRIGWIQSSYNKVNTLKASLFWTLVGASNTLRQASEYIPRLQATINTTDFIALLLGGDPSEPGGFSVRFVHLFIIF